MKWLCICPYCHGKLPPLPKETKFDREKHTCPNCKKTFRGIALRGYGELVEDDKIER